MFSDAYDTKLIDGVAYEVECKMITIKKGADVGRFPILSPVYISSLGIILVKVNTKDIDIGANASAEGGDEELEDGTETVNNVAYSFRLTQTSFDRSSYTKYLKGRRSDLTCL